MTRKPTRMAEKGSLRHCLFVTQWYTPEPSRVPAEIASVVAESMTVTVLTGVPHYPTGKPAQGYSATDIRTEVFDGIRVHRTPEYPSRSRSSVGRMISYASWAATATVFGLRRFRHAHVALVYSSPATAALPALAARLLWRTPYVLVVQDVWPDSIFAAGFSNRGLKLLRPLLDGLCRLFYRFANHVCVISPGMVDLLNARGVPRDKLSLLYNWVAPSARETEPPARSKPGPVTLLYAGNHGPAQNLAPVVEAVAAVPNLEFSLVGDGIEKPLLAERASERNARNVTFHAPETPHQLAYRVERADVQLVSLAPDPLFDVTMPSKVQAILAAGKPLLAVAGGDVASVVREARCGWVVTPGNPEELAQTLREISNTSPQQFSELGARARAYYAAHMSRERGSAVLTRVLEDASRDSRKAGVQ